MTKFTYQATSLRSLVKQMLPSAESKNITESNWCSVGLLERDATCPDGSVQHQHVLYAETTQPTFVLGVWQVLATDEANTDGTAMDLLTRDLDNALASFGQHNVQVSLHPDGQVLLSSGMATTPSTDATEPVKVLSLGGTPHTQLALPKQLSAAATAGATAGAAVISEISGHSAATHATSAALATSAPSSAVPGTPAPSVCILADIALLLDGLRSAVGIASVRGNRPDSQGVHLVIAPDRLCISGENPGVVAQARYESPWLCSPAHRADYTLSTDAVRHLISALVGFASETTVTFCCYDDMLAIQTEGVYMEV